MRLQAFPETDIQNAGHHSRSGYQYGIWGEKDRDWQEPVPGSCPSKIGREYL